MQFCISNNWRTIKIHYRMRRLISKIVHKKYSIHNVYTILRTLQFKIGTRKKTKNYIRTNEVKKLQIGCGFNITEGWLNTDIYPRNRHIIYLDAGKKFPLKNESFDYVYSEHVFEHLRLNIASNYLKESFRILKKGGRIRIAMPDIHFLMEIIKNPNLDIHKRYVTFTIDNSLPEINKKFKGKAPEQLATLIVNNFFRCWEHEIIYDFKTIYLMLEQHGFSEITQVNINESSDDNLKNMEKHGTIIPAEFNELETMVIEAVK